MGVNQVNMNGEELINLTADTVSELNLLEGETAHDARGEQITGKVTVIGDNLLDNGDFFVNQRGLTEYVGATTNNGYTVDRWRQYPSTCVVTPIEGGGVNIAYNGEAIPSGGFMRIIQLLSQSLTIGDVYTLQACIDGITYVWSVAVTDTYQNHNFGENNQYTVYLSATSIILQLNSGQSMTVLHCKLELGPVATPFIPPNRAVESVKCQRVLQFHTTGDIDPIDLRPTMRITPTVTQQSDGRWMYNAEL